MKQHITQEQLNELSDGGKEKLREWCVKAYTSPSMYQELTRKQIEQCKKHLDLELSIGQMIEFLDKLKEEQTWLISDDDYNHEDKELCDALWSACREVLEKKHGTTKATTTDS